MQKSTIILFACVLVALTNAQTLNEDRKDINDPDCYVCESSDNPQCKDFGDDILVARCSTLVYNDLSRSVGSSGYKASDALAEIFKRESSRAVTPNTSFMCIKTTLIEDGTENFIRSCAPKKDNIDNVCDFIKNELDPKYKVRDCYECKDSNCNSAFTSHASLFMQVFSILFALFLMKF